MVAQTLARQFPDLFKMIQRFFRDNSTLPVGPSKIRIFKEGQGIRWNDIKTSFLNQQSK